MPNNQIKSLTIGGVTYDIVDETSGYMTGMTILSYGSSTWSDFIEAYNKKKVIYCRASSQSNPATGSQTRLAFMAYVNDAASPTEVEFQYYRSVSTHSISQQGDQVFVYKLTSNGSWTVTTREAMAQVRAGGDLSENYSNNVLTISASIPTVPTNVSAFTNDAGYLTSYTETDPTVPSWAKASSKPSYTASEVGAAATSHAHGNITSDGDITATAPTIASGDQLIINDSSASKITNGPTFDGSTTSKYLSQKGTWESLPQGTAYSAGTGLDLSGTTFNHSNSVTAQTTQAVYPIKIDAQGHIASYGSAINIDDEIFIAEVDYTSYSDARAAFNAGKYLICLNAEDGIYAPLFHETTTDFTFTVLDNGFVSGYGGITYKLNSNGWTVSNAAFPDEKLKTAAVTSGTTYYLTVGTNTTSAETKYFDATGLKYTVTTGTSSNIGYSTLTLGNNTALGTAGNKKGEIDIYSSNTHFVSLVAAPSLAGDREIALPDKDGIVALTSDIPAVPTSATSSTTGVTVADHSTSSIYGVTSSTTSVTGVQSSTTTASKASGANGTAPSWTFEEKTIPNVTAAGSGSFTQGTFSGGSLTMSMDSTDTKQLNITFSPATHGADSHTHTAPTIGTAIKVQSKSGGSNGSASTWSFTDVTVPIKDTSATTVPVKNSSATTVVTSKTHTVTDNGHTHTLS